MARRRSVSTKRMTAASHRGRKGKSVSVGRLKAGAHSGRSPVGVKPSGVERAQVVRNPSPGSFWNASPLQGSQVLTKIAPTPSGPEPGH